MDANLMDAFDKPDMIRVFGAPRSSTLRGENEWVPRHLTLGAGAVGAPQLLLATHNRRSRRVIEHIKLE
jgi:hypothetical protein